MKFKIFLTVHTNMLAFALQTNNKVVTNSIPYSFHPFTLIHLHNTHCTELYALGLQNKSVHHHKHDYTMCTHTHTHIHTHFAEQRAFGLC
uniref:Secreted protein n=1 Tax=Anguilla anguilla TaxID=7936 RepID=A0A0E9WJ59_ANGAN